MSKIVEKAILGLACMGAAAGAVIVYRKTVKKNSASFDDDFDDFSDEFETGERNYTTIPKDSAAKANDLKEKTEDLAESVKDAASDFTEELKDGTKKIAGQADKGAEFVAEKVRGAVANMEKTIYSDVGK